MGKKIKQGYLRFYINHLLFTSKRGATRTPEQEFIRFCNFGDAFMLISFGIFMGTLIVWGAFK